MFWGFYGGKMKICYKIVLVVIIALLSTLLFACNQGSLAGLQDDIEYTLTFNSNDGTSVLPMKARQQVEITPPVSPTKTGYTFLGWYKDNGTFNSVFAFTAMPAENLTLYAKWGERAPTIPTVTVTFESNGGTIFVPISAQQGSALSALNTPSKEGFVFQGWFTDNGSFVSAFTSTTMPKQDVTLYAKWSAVKVDELNTYGTLQTIWEQRLALFREVWSVRSTFIDSLNYKSTVIGSSTVYSLNYGETTLAYESESRQTHLENSEWAYDKVTGTNIYASDHLSIYDFFMDDVTKTKTGDTYYNKIGAKLIRYAGIDTVVPIASGVTSIGSYAFFNHTKITSAVLPDGVKKISERAFAFCTALISINNFGGVESVGIGAFSDCGSLVSITMGDNLTAVGKRAFASCTSLNSVTFGSGTIIIGDEAFSNCTALITVGIPQSVELIGLRAFFGCYGLIAITVNENNNFYKSIDGNLYSKDGATFIQYAVGKENMSFNNFHGANSIENYAFYGSKFLTTITLADVTSIGDYAFSNCIKLNSVNIASTVTTIGSFAFNNCSLLTTIILPSGVQVIYSYTFYGCSALEAISIPVAVTRIDISAFYGCNALTIVNYGGNSAQWEQIHILRNNSPLNYANIIFP